MKNKSINSNAYAYIKSIIHPGLKVLDLYVRNGWLVAELSSGVRFSVRNKNTD